MERFIYKTTNLLNGKIYIGQHTTEKIDDGYLGSGVILQKAFDIYGRENFTREILKMVDGSKEDLNRTEEYYIKQYRDKVGKDRMYNISERAGGGWNKGISASTETRQKISKTMKGRQLSEEHKLKISQIQKNHPDKSKKVLCMETGEIFPSTAEAYRRMGISQGKISSVCRGRLKTTGGYHWKYV